MPRSSKDYLALALNWCWYIETQNITLTISQSEGLYRGQIDKMTCSMDVIQPFTPATSEFVQRFHEQSGHTGKDGDCTWAQQYRLPLTKADLANTIFEHLIYWEQTSLIGLKYGIILCKNKPGKRFIVLNLFHHEKVFAGIDTYSGNEFIFFIYNISFCQHYNLWTLRMP